MNELQIFQNDAFGEVRTILIEDEPFFMLSDVCRVLEIKNSRDVKSRLALKGVVTTDTLTNGGVQKADFINESNLYKLIFQSRKREAEQFADWVTSEVLPSIRKHGGYLTPEKIEEVLLNPDAIIKMATNFKEERKLRLEAEEKNKALQPCKVFSDAVSASKTSILVGELAKLLKQNGVEWAGQNRLFAWLRENGYLIKRKGSDYNAPTQRSMELEIMEIKETTIVHPDGHTSINKTPKITGKGQLYFINMFLNEKSDEKERDNHDQRNKKIN